MFLYVSIFIAFLFLFVLIQKRLLGRNREMEAQLDVIKKQGQIIDQLLEAEISRGDSKQKNRDIHASVRTKNISSLEESAHLSIDKRKELIATYQNSNIFSPQYYRANLLATDAGKSSKWKDISHLYSRYSNFAISENLPNSSIILLPNPSERKKTASDIDALYKNVSIPGEYVEDESSVMSCDN